MRARIAKNISAARYISNEQLCERTQLSLVTAKKLSKQFGAYIPIGGNRCRHDWVKFCKGMEELAKSN